MAGNRQKGGLDQGGRLRCTRNKYPWLDMQTIYPFTEQGVGRAVADVTPVKTVKSMELVG